MMLEEHWPDRPYPIVLNTESKSYEYKDMDIKTFRHYKPGKKVAWGRRLIRTLKCIDTEYILLLLDDFLLLEDVDQKRIEQCIDWMDKDRNISVFSFWRTRQPNIKNNKYPHFEKRPQVAEYRFNCQAAIWRRKELIKYLRPHESPWLWEIYGNKRSSRYKEDFYSAIEGEPYIFTYDWKGGGAIHRGRWTQSAVKLLRQYGVDIDFSVRGIENIDDIKHEPPMGLFKFCLTKIKNKIMAVQHIIAVWKSIW